MNGIKEDIKAIGVLDSGSPIYQEDLFNLSTRLKTLQVNSSYSRLGYGPSEVVGSTIKLDFITHDMIQITFRFFITLELGFHARLIQITATISIGVIAVSSQDHCNEHFEEEETELLPLMEAAELNKEHERVLEQCLEVMNGTHSHLFRFFIEGLLPQDAMHYLDLVSRCSDKQQVSSMLNMIVK